METNVSQFEFFLNLKKKNFSIINATTQIIISYFKKSLIIKYFKNKYTFNFCIH